MLLDFKDVLHFSKTYGNKPNNNIIFLNLTLKKAIFDKIDCVKLLRGDKAILVEYNEYFIIYSNVVFDCYNKPNNIIGFRCLETSQQNIKWDKNKFRSEYLKLLIENAAV